MSYLSKNLISELNNTSFYDRQKTLSTIEGLFDFIEQTEKTDPQHGFMSEIMDSTVTYLRSFSEVEQDPQATAMIDTIQDIALYIDEQTTEYRPEFHNRMHFIFVQISGRVIDHYTRHFIHLFGHETRLPCITTKDMARNALIDLIHDLGHGGGGNTRDGVYKPFLMEDQALQLAKPFMDKAGVAIEDQTIITQSVRASDPNIPHEILHAAYDYHFNPKQSKITSEHEWKQHLSSRYAEKNAELIQLVEQLYHDPVCCFSAARLADADIFTSFGLSEKRGNRETLKLDQEMKRAHGPRLCDDKGHPLMGARLYALYKIMGTRMVEPETVSVMFRTPGAQWLGGQTALSLQRQSEITLGSEACLSMRRVCGLTG